MKSAGYCLFDTPMGECGIAWRETEAATPAVFRFQLPEATHGLTEARIARNSGLTIATSPPPRVAEIIARVGKHFQGTVQDFRDVALDLDGAATFAREVYEAARAIPSGQTRSYGDLAKSVGRPAAARAVGQALGKNPIALIIPCHRVLAAGGKPGGFSAHGGRSTKAWMLAVEGAPMGPPPTLKSEKDLVRLAPTLIARDSKLAACLSRPIVFKKKSGESPYACLFSAVVHQQLSPKAASTILGRVKALFPGATIPEPEALLETPDETLRAAGLSGAKTASLKDLAAKTLDGTVPSPQEILALSDEAIVKRLVSIRGVGRWTVEMLLIFHLGRMDVLPADDYALRRVVADIYGLGDVPTPKQVIALGESWRPHRTVASLYFWNALKD